MNREVDCGESPFGIGWIKCIQIHPHLLKVSYSVLTIKSNNPVHLKIKNYSRNVFKCSGSFQST